MKRSLTLKGEALAELTSADLAGVAAAAPAPYSYDQITCPGATGCLNLTRFNTCSYCQTEAVPR